MLEIKETKCELLLDWLVENYKRFGTSIQIVSDKSQEGSQFCKGFGGIGGILRYKLELNSEAIIESDHEYFEDDY